MALVANMVVTGPLSLKMVVRRREKTRCRGSQRLKFVAPKMSPAIRNSSLASCYLNNFGQLQTNYLVILNSPLFFLKSPLDSKLHFLIVLTIGPDCLNT